MAISQTLNEFPIFTLNYTRITKQMAAVLMILLTACLMACSGSTFVKDLTDASAYLDDALLIAGAIGVIPPGVANIITAGETCVTDVVTVVQAGGSVGTIAGSSIAACVTAATAALPAGTSPALVAKLNALAAVIKNVLSTLKIGGTVAPSAAAASPRVMQAVTVNLPKMASGDKKQLAKLAAHKFAPLPAVQ